MGTIEIYRKEEVKGGKSGKGRGNSLAEEQKPVLMIT